ncbi:MAG: hypothetical protein Q4F13_14110 [Pseudomonadota bacterium]|nr:hypothetical protein [Pseudomonadota bacterium]
MRSDQGVFTQPMPPLAASARAHDFAAAGWDVNKRDSPNNAHDNSRWIGRAFCSPNGQAHCALLFASDMPAWEGGAVIWLNGEPLPVPRDAHGGSRLEDWGRWLNERYFVADLGGFYQHPHFRIRVSANGLGNIHGLWVYDVQTRTARSILPGDDDKWEIPTMEIVGDELVVCASPQDMRAGRVARRVRL